MAPSNHHVVSQLRQLIYYHLDCNILDSALFMAGRLHAYEPRAAEAAYLLALCHLRLGQLQAAYDYSKNAGSRGAHLGCAYVFAQACLGLGKYTEGVMALERSKGLWATRNSWSKSTETRRQYLPDAAAINCLLGKLLAAYTDRQRAIDYYRDALKENPFMWDAFVGLCEMGVKMEVPNVFRMTPAMHIAIAGTSDETPLGSLEDASTSTHPSQHLGHPHGNADPFTTSSRVNGETRQPGVKNALFEKLNPSSNLFTPSALTEILPDGIETPTVLTATGHPQLGKSKDAITSIREDKVLEPPLAPARKPKATGAPFDLATEAPPPRMKTSTLRSRSKLRDEGDDVAHSTMSVPSSLSTGITERKRTISGHVAQTSSTSSSTYTGCAANDPMAPQRRSVRIHNSLTRPQAKSIAPNPTNAKDVREVKKAKPVNSKTRATHATVGRVVSGNRKHGDPMEVDGKEGKAAHATVPALAAPVVHKPAGGEKAKEQESLQWLLDLFLKIGGGLYAASRYRCAEAVQFFNSIPQGQRETPWVLAQIGRALYEQQQYADAEKYFARVKSMAPSRLDDMEIYSTVLWHQKNDIDLSYLAHEVIDTDRLSPQAWCVVGNSFNLQRDHDHALKCFQRATQLAPRFAYAHTLQGHEHLASEEFDQALLAFRKGIAADPRHYNAWYGLARVCERQGKYADAEAHYRTAAGIHPTSGVLQVCLGGALEKLRRPQPALAAYERAIQLAPRSAMARYKLARAFMATGRPDRALAVLKELKDLAPDESQVHFLLGRVYKALRQKGNAIRHFTTALNLDPKVGCQRGVMVARRYADRFARRRTASRKQWRRWKIGMTTTTA